MNADAVNIFLTDQLQGRPNIRTMSKEIMMTVNNFYKTPDSADGFRGKILNDWHRPAWDSGGFQFLMGKLKDPDPMKTVDLYKRIGVKPHDLPIQLDLPPRYDQAPEVRRALITLSAQFYWTMLSHIPYIIPVVHGWHQKELEMSLEFIEDPDRLATASYAPTALRNVVGAGAHIQSGRYVLNEAGNLKGCGTHFSTGGFAIDHVNSHKSCIGAGTNKSETTPYVLDNVTSDKKKRISVGAFAPVLRPWSMGNLNPHSDVKTRLISAGAYLQSGTNACDHIANTPSRKRKKRNQVIATPNVGVIDAGIIAPINTASVCAAKKRTKVIATPHPGILDISSHATPVIDRVKSRHPKVIASAVPSKLDLGLNNSILSNGGMQKKKVSVGSYMATSIVGPKKKVSMNVILERLALVLNMLRNRGELFMLGGASPHFQHMIFMGGAKYSDTSAWRLKGYFGEIYLPEIGARSIGYKDTSKRLKAHEHPILKECLDDSTHPCNGMSVDRFLAIGHMNMTDWRNTFPQNQWEMKPFTLRALHNAWVLKLREEVIANEYAASPLKYYRYLKKRFHNRPVLTRRLEKLWKLLHRPYVQTEPNIFLKGAMKGMGL